MNSEFSSRGTCSDVSFTAKATFGVNAASPPQRLTRLRRPIIGGVGAEAKYFGLLEWMLDAAEAASIIGGVGPRAGKRKLLVARKVQGSSAV